MNAKFVPPNFINMIQFNNKSVKAFSFWEYATLHLTRETKTIERLANIHSFLYSLFHSQSILWYREFTYEVPGYQLPLKR